MRKKDNVSKYLLISIGVIIVIIFIVIGVLLLINKNDFHSHDSHDEDFLNTLDESQYYKEKEGSIDELKFNDVTDRNLFFRIEECLQLYYKFLDIDNYEETEYVPGAEESFISLYGITSDEERNEFIINLLSKKYIEENDITTQNVYDFVKPIDLDKYKVQVLEEKVYTNEKVRNYYVVAKIIDNSNYQIIDKVYYIINSNVENDFFSVYPLTGETDNMYDFISNEVIEQKDNNEVQTEVIKDVEMAMKYFSDFKMNAINKTEYAFNLLDEEYRNKRFNGEKSKFDNYIDKNIEEWSPITITEYLVNNYDGYKEYVCRDKYENVYIFKETGIMEYSVMLDTYTVITDKFKNEYEVADEQNKVMMNVDKWVQMLNNRDYEAAFNMLDETFVNNNYEGDVNVFEEKMRSIYPEHYEVAFIKFEEQPGNIYSQEILLKEIGIDTEIELGLTIIMKLEDDTDFVMSFSQDA